MTQPSQTISPEVQIQDDEIARGQRRQRIRRVLATVSAVVITAAAVALGTGLLGRRSGNPPSAAPTGPPTTATVERRTLIQTQTVSGNLGHGDVFTMLAPPGGGGMVTWLPPEGTVIKRGETVYRRDQVRVPLIYGSIPLYRTLSVGIAGGDVRQLERNLKALGYRGFTVDGEYTTSTAAAVRHWQKDLGRDRIGVVQPADAVVASGARRVAQLTSELGAAASGGLLKWTGTTRIVTVDLDTDYAELVRLGARAEVKLPDETMVSARVTRIGTPTSASGKDDGASLPVELAVTQPKRLGRYQAARVDVDLAGQTRQSVLAVPITALAARPGGGYAVIVVTGSGTRNLPVRTGLFSGSYVEISGPGVAAGLTVGAPA
jgi:peptidoglycan hydrolase-like protein with peptidoglycan-binding domain